MCIYAESWVNLMNFQSCIMMWLIIRGLIGCLCALVQGPLDTSFRHNSMFGCLNQATLVQSADLIQAHQIGHARAKCRSHPGPSDTARISVRGEPGSARSLVLSQLCPRV
jgi:hypothetical protein